MAEAGADDQVIIVTDASVLINFLRIDRMDLIDRHPCRFIITDHVAGEVTDEYPEQQATLAAALESGILEQRSVAGIEALAIFAELNEGKRLGAGESAAIALAITADYGIAIEDRKATREAQRLKADLRVLKTQDIIVHLMQAGHVTVEEADAIKVAWESLHRFTLPFGSFAELL